MKFLNAISILLSLALGIPESEWATNPPTLNPSKPIYLASVFFPPQMNFVAWTPPKDPLDLHNQNPLHWCQIAKDVTESLSSGSRTPTFELEGLEYLKIHDFFTGQAYISRHNIKFANCFVTPESRRLGMCDGRESKGEKHVGVGHLVWSCWIIKNPDRKHVLGPREDGRMEGMTSIDGNKSARKTTAMLGALSNFAFTAAVTGS